MEKNVIEIDEVYANAKNDIIAFVKNWVGLKKLQYVVNMETMDISVDGALNALITGIEENGLAFFDDFEEEYVISFYDLPVDMLYKFAKWLSFNYPKK